MSKNKEQLGAIQSLKEFLSTPGRLTLDDQKGIVEMAIIVLKEIYVHLPLKIAMYAVNPVRRLRILLHHLEESTSDKMSQEIDFHKEMLDIFTSLRDLHTNYILPSSRYAILPFLAESYGEESQRHFVVGHIGIPESFERFLPSKFELHFPVTFKPGVEITYWNGVPMKRAVDINSDKKAGSNPAARFGAHGLINGLID